MTTDGGPAFPSWKATDAESGMFLRDYFAAKAMAAMWNQSMESMEYNYRSVANEAYAMADAMLAARQPTTEGAGE